MGCRFGGSGIREQASRRLVGLTRRERVRRVGMGGYGVGLGSRNGMKGGGAQRLGACQSGKAREGLGVSGWTGCGLGGQE